MSIFWQCTHGIKRISAEGEGAACKLGRASMASKRTTHSTLHSAPQHACQAATAGCHTAHAPARDLIVIGAVGQPVPQHGVPLREEVGFEQGGQLHVGENSQSRVSWREGGGCGGRNKQLGGWATQGTATKHAG